MAQQNGEIYIYAADSNAVANNVAANKGLVSGSSEVLVSGTLDASGTGAGQTGGAITVTGDHVGILSGANINASGDAGGGAVQIGGDFHGAGTTPTSEATIVQQGATINANAITSGNGGSVAVWSDGYTNFAGAIEATGGSQSGNGGYVETSGHQTLDVSGTVDTSAANGAGGSWLLDPAGNVTIDGNATSHPNPLTTNWSSTGTSDVLYSDIQNFLNGNSSVTITTTGGSITVAHNIDTTTTASPTLTLAASDDITVNTGITIEATGSGSLNVVFDADTVGGGAASGGAILMSSGSSIVTNGGNIIMGGQGSPATLAAVGNPINNNYVGVYINGATLNAGNGSITLTGTGGSGSLEQNGVAINGGTVEVSGTGNISITGTGGVGGGYGVYITGGGLVKSTDATGNASLGTITINGTNNVTGSGNNNYGVYIGYDGSTGGPTGGNVTSVDGTISITGTGGNVIAGNNNYGIVMDTSSNVSASGIGGITMNGTGGGNSNNGSNEGINIFDSIG